MPSGFPKGNTPFTTPKVIVARAFPPPEATWKYASRPFDPDQLRARDARRRHRRRRPRHDASVDGRAGLRRRAERVHRQLQGAHRADARSSDSNGNSPEIVKGIDAAVADGMNVINLSLGEPEIDPDRDIVVKAINAAADAGVVPAIAAGNDFDGFGNGSISLARQRGECDHRRGR